MGDGRARGGASTVATADTFEEVDVEDEAKELVPVETDAASFMVDFAPFYTRQPREDTWRKQREMWCNLIIRYVKRESDETKYSSEESAGGGITNELNRNQTYVGW